MEIIEIEATNKSNFDLIVDLVNAKYKTEYLKMYETFIFNGGNSVMIADALRKHSDQNILHMVKSNGFWTRKYRREYEKVLKSWLVLGEKLGLTDSMDLSIFLNALLYDGYLSFNHQFFYDASGRINKMGLYYFDVFNGSGVCMNFSYLLSDFLNKAGYKTSTMLCNCKDEDMVSLDYNPHKEKFKVKSRINYDDIPNENDRFNHMVTLVYENHVENSCYLYDMTNRLAFNIEDMNRALLMAGDGKVCLNPVTSYLCSFTKETRYVLENFIASNCYNAPFCDADFKKKYHAVREMCKENKERIDENYLLTKDTLTHISKACSHPKILKLKNL